MTLPQSLWEVFSRSRHLWVVHHKAGALEACCFFSPVPRGVALWILWLRNDWQSNLPGHPYQLMTGWYTEQKSCCHCLVYVSWHDSLTILSVLLTYSQESYNHYDVSCEIKAKFFQGITGWLPVFSLRCRFLFLWTNGNINAVALELRESNFSIWYLW